MFSNINITSSLFNFMVIFINDNIPWHGIKLFSNNASMEVECFQTSVLSFCDDLGNWEDQSKIGTCEKGFIASQFCFHFIDMLALQNTKCMWILRRCIIALPLFHILRPPYFLAYLLHLDPSRFILMRSSWYNLLQVGSSWITQAHLGPFLFIWIHIGTEGLVSPNVVRLSVR